METFLCEDMRYMFCGCSSLQSLPDISKWNTENLKNIRIIFNECKKFIALPDISKWNTSKIINNKLYI